MFTLKFPIKLHRLVLSILLIYLFKLFSTLTFCSNIYIISFYIYFLLGPSIYGNFTDQLPKTRVIALSESCRFLIRR